MGLGGLRKDCSVSKGKGKYDILKDAAAVLAKARDDNRKYREAGLMADWFSNANMKLPCIAAHRKFPRRKRKFIAYRLRLPYGQTEDTKL